MKKAARIVIGVLCLIVFFWCVNAMIEVTNKPYGTILKAWTGEYSKEKRQDAITQYQKHYDPIVFNDLTNGVVSFETDFEVSACRVPLVSKVDNDDIKVELQGYIDLALPANFQGNKITISTDWWCRGGGAQDYPVWSYLVCVRDSDGAEHYYYFRVDYSSYTASSEKAEGNE